MGATTTTPAALTELLRNELAARADPGRAPGMQAYMKSAIPFHGIGAVPLERLCRRLFDVHPLPDEDAWQAAIRDLWDGVTHREEWYAALHLAGHRRYRDLQQVRILELYQHLVVTGAWWDVVDQVASRRVGPILRAHHREVEPILRGWAVADDLWLRRTAILSQLGSGPDTDTDLLAQVIDANLDGSDRRTPAESPYGREFFVRKAIGWALRQYARTDDAWVSEFVAARGPRLSGLSRREALKHIFAPGPSSPRGATR